MLQPQQLISRAQHSGFYLWLLNIALKRIVPFNSPHKFRIEKITGSGMDITLPYIRKNLNHLKGLHACALAALSEYTCGLTLIRNFPAGEYRLIMKELQMIYHFQGKESAIARFSIPAAVIEKIKSDLKSEDVLFHTFEVDCHDISGNHLCTGKVTWQLKNWKAVKTRA